MRCVSTSLAWINKVAQLTFYCGRIKVPTGAVLPRFLELLIGSSAPQFTASYIAWLQCTRNMQFKNVPENSRNLYNRSSLELQYNNLTRTLPQWLLWRSHKKPDWLHQHTRYQWNFFLPHRPFNTTCTVPSTSNLSRILVIVTLIGGDLPNSTLSFNVSNILHFPVTHQLYPKGET